MNYRDSNYTIYIKAKAMVIDCFTVEQVVNNMNLYSQYTRVVYRMNHTTRKAEIVGKMKGGDKICT